MGVDIAPDPVMRHRMPKQKPHRSEQSVATPLDFLVVIKRALQIKEFAWDFTADEDNTVSPVGHFNERLDALRQPDWHKHTGGGGWGWLNPPYSKIAPWVERCHETATDGGHLALLVPAGVGANWFRDWVHGKSRVIFLNGRLTFQGHTAPYPKDCMLCLYGPDVAIGYNVWNWRTDECPL